MTPAEIIKPFLLEADRRKQHLRIDNRFASCGELLEDTLALAGPDWLFIGKSGRKGEAGFRPAWFAPTWLELRRDDGQMESVLIDQLGMDAAWYMPTHQQVKVIANSTANELPIGDSRRGPANLTPYMISEFHPETHARQWRWWNPPIPQRSGGPLPVPVPMPGPTPAPGGNEPDRDEMRAAGEWLHAYYKSQEGLQRPQGLSINNAPDWEGVGAWLFDVYFRARRGGASVEQARAKVVSEIRHAGGPNGEWQVKHPGQTP